MTRVAQPMRFSQMPSKPNQCQSVYQQAGPAANLSAQAQGRRSSKPVADQRSSAALEREGFTIIKKIGQGNQCTAFLGADENSERFCIKAFDKAKIKGSAVDNIKAEYEMLRTLEVHPAIPEVFNFFSDDKCYFMVQTHYEGGDFTTLRKNTQSSWMTEDWWRSLFRQCFQGLEHLQANSLMHCDIKEPNLMLKTEQYLRPEVAIIDFGLARTYSSKSRMVSGTAGYIPPEVWDNGKCYPEGDMFSMGVVIMQMILNRVPPHHKASQWQVLPGGIFTKGVTTLQEATHAVKTREPPFESMPSEFEGLTEVCRRLLDKRPKARPLAHEVLTESWFATEDESRGTCVVS